MLLKLEQLKNRKREMYRDIIDENSHSDALKVSCIAIQYQVPTSASRQDHDSILQKDIHCRGSDQQATQRGLRQYFQEFSAHILAVCFRHSVDCCYIK